MSKPALVLDNSVLSSLFTAGWFDAPSFYSPEQRIFVSDSVWNGEFTPYHEIESEPDWIDIREVDLESVRTRALGQLSRPDWSCIAIAEQLDGNSTVVTNDRALRSVTDRREVDAEWGTHFVIRTFKACGISVSEFEEGVEAYLSDVTLPSDVEEEVRNTEK
jgi:hypothetical protein